MVVYLVCALAAYCIGTINPAYIFARIKKVELRNGGSGNLGASNAATLLGWQYGVLVGFLDILKACIPIMFARFVITGYQYLPFVIVTAVIFGHMFPFYLKFRGGKGFAAFFGSILGIHWLAFIIIGAVFLIVVVLSDKIVFGTFTVISLFPVYIGIVDRNWIFVSIILVASVVIFLKHIENIKRLYHREEIGIREALAGKYKE